MRQRLSESVGWGYRWAAAIKHAKMLNGVYKSPHVSHIIHLLLCSVSISMMIIMEWALWMLYFCHTNSCVFVCPHNLRTFLTHSTSNLIRNQNTGLCVRIDTDAHAHTHSHICEYIIIIIHICFTLITLLFWSQAQAMEFESFWIVRRTYSEKFRITYIYVYCELWVVGRIFSFDTHNFRYCWCWGCCCCCIICLKSKLYKSVFSSVPK